MTTFELPALPYAADALQPHMSAETLAIHHGKHHQAYVTNLNNLLTDSPLKGQSLEAIIAASANNDALVGVFNNAAQVWNHTFFWHSLTPNGGSKPTDAALLAKIEADFGSFEAFVQAFKTAAATQFGSGWAWLVLDNGTLKITKTSNAQTPLTQGQVPLLTLDVWEHAYYVDYRNRRPDFIETFVTHLANWQFAAQNYAKAIAA